ncbi:class I SAM-dependent methyltransferase [Streptomyces natalensis]|uniref:class I SAM-dependent methyltransferase n=1 Tax=Streptomyces natalensis TaxID=68242 RepID=UPI0007C4B292|nr:class I SAM-dependent methyltransferase [Streptomyces natalensis]
MPPQSHQENHRQRPPQQFDHAARARSFSSVAAQYAASRPGYPAELFDAIEERSGRSLNGARVLDVGAGTGIATALLAARGAEVIAVEPGPGMAAQLRAGLPGVPLVRASGDALPFRAAAFDLVCYAQAWHWTDPARSAPEAMRVLRPGGALALWWNSPRRDTGWAAEQDARLARRLLGRDPGRAAEVPDADPDVLVRRQGLNPTAWVAEWTRSVPLDTHLAMLGSHSRFAVLDPAVSAAILEDERAALLDVFPDGIVREEYRVQLTVTSRTDTPTPTGRTDEGAHRGGRNASDGRNA